MYFPAFASAHSGIPIYETELPRSLHTELINTEKVKAETPTPKSRLFTPYSARNKLSNFQTGVFLTKVNEQNCKAVYFTFIVHESAC